MCLCKLFLCLLFRILVLFLLFSFILLLLFVGFFFLYYLIYTPDLVSSNGTNVKLLSRHTPTCFFFLFFSFLLFLLLFKLNSLPDSIFSDFYLDLVSNNGTVLPRTNVTSNYFPGMLQQTFDVEQGSLSVGVTMQLVFVSSRSSVVSVSVKNNNPSIPNILAVKEK